MFIEANGIRLFYEQQGSGRPILLVHGNSESHEKMQPLMAMLQGSYAVYAPDSRDHGQSDKVAELHYQDMADDMAALIQTLNLEKPVLIGSSDGGIIGLQLAISHPDLLGGLVSAGANTRPEELRWWFTTFAKLGYRATKDPKLRMMLEEPQLTPEMLGQIRTPTLVLAGERDILAEKYTRALAENIPGSTLHILRGEGHSSYIKHPERMEPVLLPFLASLP